MLPESPVRPALALRVGFILAQNFTLSALSLFVDPLRLAADEGDRSRPIRCSWAIMAGSGEPTRSSCGLSVGRTAPFVDPRSFDYVVVVGGLLHAGQQIDPATETYLKTAALAGVPLIGVCTGSFVLARAGLMKGRRACVSWYHHADYEAEFDDTTPLSDQLFLVDHDRITCAGGAGVADLAAYLIEKHLGRSVAQKALHVLLLQHARAASDAQPHAFALDRIGDERVKRALRLMEQNIAEPLTIDAIAGKLALSTRQLERLFQGRLRLRPAVVYRQLRLRHARWLLENTRKPVTAIAVETGFCDAAHFSRQFKSYFNLSPSLVRAARVAGEAEPAPSLEPSAPLDPATPIEAAE
ncbi:GlxA family transcriptional regulator [Salinarimonas sp.]|uniref:GlxA family transcriptional regulator n=1 Tax=Salinarimonas sp. TaxID=2766526 RepID=UPI0032D92BF9